MYSLLLAIIYVAFVGLGLPDSLIGAGWPVMQADLGVPVTWAGILTMLIAGSTIVSSLLSERLTRRLGTGLVTGVSVGATAAALVGFSVSDTFWMLCLWAIPFGLGAGAVDAALNNYVALHYAARHMNWLHSFWGVGASISPFIMSHAISSGMGWSGAYRTIAIVQAVLTVLLLLSLPLWRRVDAGRGRRPSERDDAEGALHGHVRLRTVLAIRGVVPVLIAFFAYCAVEATTMLWAATYLTDRGVAPATAAAFASLYLLGITLGRLLAGVVADRIGDHALIRGGFVAVGVAALLIVVPVETDLLALAGLVLAGLGSAPIYPAIIHSTPVNFGRRNSQAIIGVQMAAAYSGSTLAPPLFGALAGWTGLWILPLFLLCLVVVGLTMSGRVRRLRADGTPEPA